MRPAPVEELVMERRGTCAEAWERYSLDRRADGTRVILEGHNYRYALTPTPHVLEGLTRALRAVEPAELLAGTVTLGQAGVRALEHLSARHPSRIYSDGAYLPCAAGFRHVPSPQTVCSDAGSTQTIEAHRGTPPVPRSSDRDTAVRRWCDDFYRGIQANG